MYKAMDNPSDKEIRTFVVDRVISLRIDFDASEVIEFTDKVVQYILNGKEEEK